MVSRANWLTSAAFPKRFRRRRVYTQKGPIWRISDGFFNLALPFTAFVLICASVLNLFCIRFCNRFCNRFCRPATQPAHCPGVIYAGWSTVAASPKLARAAARTRANTSSRAISVLSTSRASAAGLSGAAARFMSCSSRVWMLRKRS